MENSIDIDIEMIKRYDRAGPRYTSYPTAVSFTDDFRERSYKAACTSSNNDLIPSPLSLYFHIPFCDTVCFYCACNKIVTKHRARTKPYMETLLKEIEMQGQLFAKDREVLQLHLGGGTPTFLSTGEISELMWKVESVFNVRSGTDKDFSIEIDPRSVDDSYIQTLGKLGFNRYSLGVQDLDPVVQKAVNRVQPIEIVEDVLASCREAGGKSINLDLIYGLPFQTPAGFADTVKKIIKLSPDRLSVFNYAHLPEIFKPQRRINAGDLPSPEDKLEILQTTINQLMDAGYVYIGMDHFAKPNDELVLAREEGGLHRNFQGYTTHGNCDLVGMGVSSISSVRGVFSQNAKDEISYADSIESGHLAVIRGVTSTLEDRLRWHVIQKLSCYNEVDKQQVAIQFQINFDEHFVDALKLLEPMIEDELVSVDAERITVLPKGRLLTRNICMVFDADLNDKNHQKPRYSRAI